ncbi:MAG: putative DNA modification/repair radical SAM protein [Clostridium sp.]|jgi:putative DNA modification/repair radical SAM protein|nr:putative DNA modification/repair radical SAM protein [Clostridium sp.]
MFEIAGGFDIQEKLHILADAAKYDVACTSSGVKRKGQEGMLGNAESCGICHSFASDGRCISLLKILMTNHCIYDCKYCVNRVSNDVPRATFTPEEICELTVEFYKRNYIEGLFLSSGVLKDPTYTMEKMCETLSLLRTKYAFNGYIHVKTIPGASDELLATAGFLADRISVNLELPTAEGLKRLAPNKSFQTILKPMKRVSATIAESRQAIGKSGYMERSSGNAYLPGSIFEKNRMRLAQQERYSQGNSSLWEYAHSTAVPAIVSERGQIREFAPAGQSTQMIIGATDENDYTLLQTTQRLYQTYDLKRVFYSAYIPINEDQALPGLDTPVPLLREHRLYQADWLLRFYGFQADELLSETRPNFNVQLDPKCDWALRHLGEFPVEVRTASYDVLLRVPGIGPKSAGRIVNARRYGSISFEHLKKMGVVLKRAHYFITCGGKMMYRTPIEEQYITRQLTGVNTRENWQIQHQQEDHRQMSLFDDFGIAR